MEHPRFFLSLLSIFSFCAMNGQVLVWAGEGAVLHTTNIESQETEIIYQPNTFSLSNRIEQIEVDLDREVVYFHLHIEDTSEELLMRISLEGGSSTVISANFDVSSMVFDNTRNIIYYADNLGSGQDVDAIRSIDPGGNEAIIHDCIQCSGLRLDENDGEIYYRKLFEKEKVGIDGLNVEVLDFFPPVQFNVDVLTFSVDGVNDKVYWSSFFPLLSANIIGYDLGNASIDTLLNSTVNNTGLGQIEIRPSVLKGYFFHSERTIFQQPEEAVVTFRSISLLDSNAVTVLFTAEDEVKAWSYVPPQEVEDVQLKLEHYNERLVFGEPQEILVRDCIQDGGECEFGVCYDGSQTSFFELTGNNVSYVFEEGEFLMRAKNDPESSNPENFGQFGVPQLISPTVLRIPYTHPQIPLQNEDEGEIILEIVHVTEGELVAMEVHVKLVPPPVLLIHGLGGSGTGMKELDVFLKESGRYSSLYTRTVDYGPTNNAAFDENSSVLIRNSAIILNEVNSSGVSAGEVDVVGHSMGGLLTRLYLQSDEYDANINRIVTLNTPHSGSQVADQVLFLRANNDLDNVCTVLGNIGIDCEGGAIRDLQVNEGVIDNPLNGEGLNRRVVPSHAIVTSSNNRIAERIIRAALDIPIELLFGGEQHDLIVSLSSQSGGLVGPQRSNFVGIHPGSYNLPDLQERVLNLLRHPANGPSFSQVGFSPVDLNHIPVDEDPDNFISVNLSSTYEGLSVEVGQDIDISITSEADDAMIIVNGESIFAPSDLLLGFARGTVDTTISLTVSRIGIIPITLLASSNTSRSVGRDSILINVTTSQSPVEIDLESKVVEDGSLFYSNAYASFTSFNADISGADNVEYFFTNGIVTYEGDGYLRANSVGTDTMYVVFNGTTSPTVPVTILPRTTTSIDEVRVNQASALDIIVSPNPINSEFSVMLPNDLDWSEIQSCRLYNTQGHLVRAWNEITVDEGATFEVSGLPAGMYLFSVLANGKMGTAKIIKH